MATIGFTELQPRQRKYLEGRAAGLSKEEAKRNAQYAATTSPHKIETPSVKAAFSRLMRRAAPAHKLVKVIEEGLSATRTMAAMVPKDAEPQTVEVPDFKERREYAKLAAEWGGYVEEEKKSGDTNVAVGITLINGVTVPKKGLPNE